MAAPIETARETPNAQLAPETIEFYREAMQALDTAAVPFLVGGAYAFARYTGIERHTKDFDIFVLPADFERALDAFIAKGWEAERTFPHWLGKTFRGEDFVDVIFSSGNGVARVDDLWFEKAVKGTVLGLEVRLVPAEEMIWSKSFIMERERFDGADVVHMLRASAGRLDWARLLRRFGPHWRLLLAHLVLFGLVYPDQRDAIPARVMELLTERLRRERDIPAGDGRHATPDGQRLCHGTLLSREQYLCALEQWGYQDARLLPPARMSEEEIADWTAAIATR
jgi:Uncharacterised nucleotidyltransferase